METIIAANCSIICTEIHLTKHALGTNMLISDLDVNGFCPNVSKDEINNCNSVLVL